MRLRNKALIIELKEARGGACERCGYSKCLRALTFHHREPHLKLFKVSNGNTGSWTVTALKAEAEKCDLICANCHAEEHADE